MNTLPDPDRRAALAAGLLYVLIILLGLSGEILVRAPLIDPAAPEVTAANLVNYTGMFRLSMAMDAAMVMADVAVGVLLFLLLRPFGPIRAGLALAFRMIQAAVLAANLLNVQHALGLAADGMADAAPQVLALHGFGYDMGLVYFGVATILTGSLLIGSRTLPSVLGWLLVASGAVYLTGSFLRILAPGLSEAFQMAYLLPVIGETAFAVWLVRAGLRRGPARSEPAQARL